MNGGAAHRELYDSAMLDPSVRLSPQVYFTVTVGTVHNDSQGPQKCGKHREDMRSTLNMKIQLNVAYAVCCGASGRR